MSLDLDRTGWNRVQFGEVLRRSRRQCDPFEAGVKRYVAGGHIDTESVVIRRSGDINDGQAGSTFRYLFEPGDVLFVSARPYLRKVGVPDFGGVVADKTYVLSAAPGHGLIHDLLPFVLTSDRFIEYANQEATGSMNPRLLWGAMQRYELELPPPGEQQRIADLLWAAEMEARGRAAVCDSLIALRMAHLHERMSEIAITSGTVSLDSLIEPGRPVTYGILMPGSGHPGGVPVVKVKDYPAGRIEEDGLHLTTPELAYEYRRSTLRPGDLLISIRGTVGRLAEVPAALDGGNITQDTARLTIDRAHDRQYVRLVLESPFAQSQIRRLVTGLAVKGLNIGALRKLHIPIPSNKNDERLLVEESSAIDAAIVSAKQARESAITLRSSLLTEVFGGN